MQQLQQNITYTYRTQNGEAFIRREYNNTTLYASPYLVATNKGYTKPHNPALSLWLSVDPLSDKYSGVSPYVYCGDNPVKLVDVDGREVVTSEEGLEIIRRTVCREDAEFIRLTDDGRIDKELLNQCGHNEGNIGKLKNIVNRSEVVNFIIGEQIEYKTDDGVAVLPMGDITVCDISPDFRLYSPYDLSTNEYGLQGQSQYPDGIGYGASANGSYNVILNAQLSFQGKVETTGHELYGHIYLELNGYESTHQSNASYETNLLLKETIIEAICEIRGYFKQ